MDLSPPHFSDHSKISIGFISDTHGLLRTEAIDALRGRDVILHAGDVGNEMILDELELLAPVYTVRGNVDYQNWCGRLPNKLTLELAGLKIHMIHDIQSVDPRDLKEAHLVVYGHSHRPEIRQTGGVVNLNPGSAGPRRFSLPVTLAKLDWEFGDEELSPELIQLL